MGVTVKIGRRLGEALRKEVRSVPGALVLRRVPVAAAAAFAYVLAAVALLPAVGDDVLDLALLVAAVAGARFGLRAGLVGAALTTAVDLLLLAVAGFSGWNPAVNVPHVIATFALGGGFGALRDSRARSAVREKVVSAMTATAPIVLFSIDREGTFTASQGSALAALGLVPGEVVGRSVFDVYRNVPEVVANVRRALAGEDFRATVTAGPATFDVRYVPTRDERGEISGVTGVAVDVTERERSQRALAEAFDASERQRVAANAIAQAAGVLAGGAAAGETLPSILRAAQRVVPADGAGLVVFRGGTFEIVAATGLAEEWTGRRSERAEGIWGRAASTGRSQIVPNVEADPESLEWVRSFRSVLSVPVVTAAGTIAVMHFASSEAEHFTGADAELLEAFAPYVAAALDGDQRLSQIRDREGRLRETERQLAFIVRNLPLHLFALDASGVFTLSEGAAAPDVASGEAPLVGRSVFEVWRQWPQSLDRIRRALAGDEVLEEGERDGHAFQLHLTPVTAEDGAVAQVIAVAVDVTERRRAEREIERLLLHDRLTGLPNRALVQDRLEQAIAAARRLATSVAVLALEVGPIQDVNDTYGYDAGDALIREVGPRLASLLRQTDTLGRIGGDEFVVILPGADTAGAGDVAQKLLAVFRGPFSYGGHVIYARARIGIAVSPAHGDDAGELLRRADMAMTAAGGSATDYAVYLSEHEEQPARVALMSDLRRALDSGGLSLAYQPIVRVSEGAPVQVEALLRWAHPDRGWLSPADFVAAAEEAGLMGVLTDRVLDIALRQCRRWQEEGIELAVSVNVSARNLMDPGFCDGLVAQLRETQVEPGRIVLEITESVLMADRDLARAAILKLRDIGVAVEIDDFGTGYSSLAYLSRLPATALKIDQAFVQPMRSDETCAEIVRATIQLAHNLGFLVIAEGVEDAETLTELQRLSCDYAQGFHIGAPMSADEVERWLTEAKRIGSSARVGSHARSRTASSSSRVPKVTAPRL